MNRSDIITRLLDSKAAFEEQGVAHLSMFGSQARGESKIGSDLDLLLEVPSNPDFSILELASSEQMVAEQTGITTNAFLKRSLSPEFEKAIAADLVTVF